MVRQFSRKNGKRAADKKMLNFAGWVADDGKVNGCATA